MIEEQSNSDEDLSEECEKVEERRYEKENEEEVEEDICNIESQEELFDQFEADMLA